MRRVPGTGRSTKDSFGSWWRTCGSTARSLRQEWATRITDAHLLSAMTAQEVFSEATSVYDNYVEVLETGSVEALQHYARDLSERIIPRGVETHEVVGIVLLLRDVLARSLFEKYHKDFDALEPGSRRLRARREPDRQHRRGELRRRTRAGDPPAAGLDAASCRRPVLQVRERLLILPIIGVLDSHARQPADRTAAARRSAATARRWSSWTSPAWPTWTKRSPTQLVAGGGRIPADGGRGHHHRPVVEDRADAGHHRGGSRQDANSGGPSRRNRGSRAGARIPGGTDQS